MSIDATSDSNPQERYFGLRPALRDLEVRAVRGGAALFVASGGSHLVRLLTTLLLARLLTPADFGVFAIGLTFAGIAGLLTELGLTTVTVQREALTPSQVDTLFWINLGAGALLTATGLAAAPMLGSLYGDARVEAMCRLLAFGPLLAALGMQHLALLHRALRFSWVAAIGLAASAVGSLCALWLASLGHSFAALGAGVLVTNGVSTALAWVSCRWRPGRPRADPSLRDMLTTGTYLVAFGILAAAGGTLHNVLLGLASGVDSAGIYYRAHSLLQLVQGLVIGSFASVAIATLSRLQREPEEFRRYYLRAVSVLCWICAPAAALGWLFAGDVMLLAFGEQWTASAPLFATLCIGLVWYALSYSTGWIYIATGNPRRMMRWGVVGWSAIILGTIVGLPLGLRGLAIAQTVTIIVVFVPCMLFAFRGTGLTLRALAASTWRPLLAALAAALGVTAVFHLLPQQPLARLIAGGALFTTLYVVLLSEGLGQRPQLVEFSRNLIGGAKTRRAGSP